MTTNRSSDEELGQKLAEYHSGGVPYWMRGLPFFLVVIVILAIITRESLFVGFSLQLAILGTLIVIAGLFRRLLSRETIALYEIGLIHRRGRKKFTCQWDEIAGVDVKPFFPRGVYDHFLIIYLKNGSKIKTGAFARIDAIEDDILGGLRRHVLPQLIKRLDAGETINFGPLHVKIDRIFDGVNEYPFDSVLDVQFTQSERVKLLVLRPDNTSEWVMLEGKPVPNLYLLGELVTFLLQRLQSAVIYEAKENPCYVSQD